MTDFKTSPVQSPSSASPRARIINTTVQNPREENPCGSIFPSTAKAFTSTNYKGDSITTTTFNAPKELMHGTNLAFQNIEYCSVKGGVPSTINVIKNTSLFSPEIGICTSTKIEAGDNGYRVEKDICSLDGKNNPFIGYYSGNRHTGNIKATDEKHFKEMEAQIPHFDDNGELVR